MKVTRRTFVATGAAATVAGSLQAAEEKPILRIGAISDDHLHPQRPETHIRTKACFELFRKMNTDIVVDTGDIADLSHLSELAAFRKYFDDAFAGTDCVPFFCIANHDYNYLPNTKKNDPVNFMNASRALKMDGPNPACEVKGYQFVNVFQNEPRPGAFAEAVAKAVAANKGNRPVFVVNHVPPMLTTTGTIHWSSQGIRDVLNKYPQVVALTGHIHASVKWAANIWQGEFTAINLGAHAEYSNKIRGEAMVLDVFADRIDVRRYEAVSGREIGADDRWSIPLPLDPAHGPYREEVRAKASVLPKISDTAKLAFEQDATGAEGKLVFTSAEPRDKTRHYRISLESQQENGAWKFLGMLNWSVPQVMDEPEKWECPIQPAMLDGGKPHRATLVPVNCYDKEGPARVFSFTVPINPMKRLPDGSVKVVRILSGARASDENARVGADGWFSKKNGAWRCLVLGKEFTAAIQDKKVVTLVFDLASEQKEAPNTFSIAKFGKGSDTLELGLGARIYTIPSSYASHRYVWTIHKGKKPCLDDQYVLVIREGGTSKYKVNGVSCYVR